MFNNIDFFLCTWEIQDLLRLSHQRRLSRYGASATTYQRSIDQ
jgi:hypothetical protein